MLNQTLYQTRRSIVPKEIDEQQELQRLCETTFIGAKYGMQLREKADRIINKIKDYQLQIQDIETMPILASFAFDKQDLELLIIEAELVHQFLDRKGLEIPNKDQVQNSLYKHLQYVKEKIGQLVSDYFHWVAQNYPLVKANQGGIDINLFLKFNNEETGKHCNRQAEEIRNRILKEAKIVDPSQIQGRFIPFKQFRKQYEFYFPNIPIERLIQTENLFLQSIIKLNELQPAQDSYNHRYHTYYYQHLTYKINESANPGEKQLLIPRYLLETVRENKAHNKLFEIMIQENIEVLNNQGEEQVIQALRQHSRIRPRPQEMQMPNQFNIRPNRQQ